MRSRLPHPAAGALRRALCLAPLLAAGCRSAPETAPLAVPFELGARVDYHPGSVLGGASRFSDTVPLDPDPADALALELDVLYLERMPPTTLALLPTRVELVAALEGRDPVLPSSLLLSRTRVGADAEAERVREELAEGQLGSTASLAQLRAALPVGATAMFSLTAEGPGARLARSVPREFTIHLGRTSEGLAVCLTVRDLPTRAAEGAPPEDAPLGLEAGFGRDAARELQRELIALSDRPEVGGAPLALLVPSPFEAERVVAFFLRAAPPLPPAADPAAAQAHAEATAACLVQIEEAVRLALERSTPGSSETARRRGLVRVLAELDASPDARAVLVALASAAGGRVALDLALVGDDAIVARWTAALAAERPPTAEELGGEELAWLLDRSALEVLARALMEGVVPLELEAILLVHAGQLGRFPNAVLEGLEGCADRACFREIAVLENEGFLRDSEPGARVRAFDWLAAHDLAPPGFDPLGAPEARSEALRQATEAAARTAGEPER